jgi:RNA polymerase sigma-70 factor (ECF subfamily)
MKQELLPNTILDSTKDDKACLEQLTHRDKLNISCYIRHYIRDISLVEDILQDTMLKVFQSVKEGKYTDDGKFISWVKRIAHNLIIDHFRQVKQMNTISNDNYESDLFNSTSFAEDNVEDDMIKREMHYDVRNMISRLSVEQKEVVILKHYTGLSFKEIAVITNVSINTALGRMRYALLNLRKMMDEKIACLALT